MFFQTFNGYDFTAALGNSFQGFITFALKKLLACVTNVSLATNKHCSCSSPSGTAEGYLSFL